MIPGLTAKEICELRLKCIEPILQTASKVGIEKLECISIAEKVWEFVIKPLGKKEEDKPGK